MTTHKGYNPDTLGELLTAALGRTLLGGETPLAEVLFMRLQPDEPALFFRELYAFGLLPFDMALTVEAPPEAERARASLHAATLRALNSTASDGDRSLAPSSWAAFVRTRFDEYLQHAAHPLPGASQPGPSYEKTSRQVLYNLAGASPSHDSDSVNRIQSHLALALPYAIETIRAYRQGAV